MGKGIQMVSEIGSEEDYIPRWLNGDEDYIPRRG